MASVIRQAAETCISRVDPSFSVKPKQFEALENILYRYDTLGILPTNYGKSMIYQLLPAVCKLLPGQPNEAIVIVFSPLKALIENQVDEANKLSKSLHLKATTLDGSYQQIRCGKFNVIIDTPEAWLNGSRWKEMLSSQLFRKNVVCLVVDEAHKVEWGTPSSRDGQIFREAFSRIGEVRSFCSERVPVLALSATVDRDYSQLISVSCNLSHSLKFVYYCSDRKNIRLSFVKLDKKDVNCFSWVFDLVINQGVQCPKIIIYTYSQELAGWLYEKFELHLGEHRYLSCTPLHENLLIAMYHADTPGYNKERVMDSLTRDSGNIRIVIATSALGCGVNCKGVKYVLHYGPSHGLVEYCQQIGRAGRSADNELLCHAVLYSYPQGSSVISKQMREYIKEGNSSCLRSRLFTPFNKDNEKVSPISPAHRCCSFCSMSCGCGLDDCLKCYPFENSSNKKAECEFKVAVREVLDEDKFNIRDLLCQFHHSFDDSLRIVPSAFSSGLTAPIVNRIISELQYIDSPHYLLNTCIVDETWAQRIFDLIKDYFNREPKCTPSPKKLKVETSLEEKYEFTDSSEYYSSDTDYDDENL